MSPLETINGSLPDPLADKRQQPEHGFRAAIEHNHTMRFWLIVMFIAMSWFLYFTDKLQVLSPRQLAQGIVDFAARYGYVALLLAMVVTIARILWVEWIGIIHLRSIDEESLDTVEISHPYLPKLHHIIAAIILALTFPLFVWQAGAQAMALTLETMPEPAYTVYEEARVWQIANDASKTWDGGGTGTNCSEDANWSGDTKPIATDDVIFDATSTKNITWDASCPSTVNSFSMNAGYTGTGTFVGTFNVTGDMFIGSGHLLTAQNASGAIKIGSNLTLGGDAKITVRYWKNTGTGSGQLIAVGGNMLIGTGAIITADALGFAASAGPGVGLGTADGGSHGGVGGDFTDNGTAFYNTYGSYLAPMSLGSGGQGGGAGGGAIRFTVNGSTAMHGMVSANGGIGGNRGGAGGSVYLTTGTFAGSGTIRVNGGSDSQLNGGGGRIAIILTSTNATFAGHSGTISAYGGNSTYDGAAGTVYKEEEADAAGAGKLIIDNANALPLQSHVSTAIPAGQSWAISQLILQNRGIIQVGSGETLVLQNNITSDADNRNDGIRLFGGTLTLSSGTLTVDEWAIINDYPTTLTGTVVVASGGLITHSDNSTAEIFRMNLTVNGDFTLQSGGAITVDTLGYDQGQGPGKGVSLADGGSHGGVGGDFGANGTVLPNTYGSFSAPTTLGSGSDTSASGGGAAQLTVTGLCTINGVISANGNSTGNRAGAGGSVYVTAGTLAGNGTIRANGGEGNNTQAGGGGGRVAVVLTGIGAGFSGYTGRIIAYGGNGISDPYDGAAGTVYKQTATQGATRGNLIIANFPGASVMPQVVTNLDGVTARTGTAGLLTVSGATFRIGGDDTFVVIGTGTSILMNTGSIVMNGNRLTIGGTGATIRSSGRFVSSGSYAVTNYIGQENDADVIVGSGSYRHLGFNNPGTTFKLASRRHSINIAGNLSLTGGTLTVTNAQTISLSGSWINAGGTFSAGTGTLQFWKGSSGTKTINETSSLYNLTISGASTIELGANIDVNGSLLLSAGTLDASVSNYAINVAGNWWKKNGTTFTKRSGTVTLDGSGNQTISGSTVFNALSATTSVARTIFFDYTGRQSASGSLTLRGVSGNKLSLRSTRSGSGARVDLDADVVQLDSDFAQADVQDINAGSGQTLICGPTVEGCVNSGNNTNWDFSNPAPSVTGTVYSNTGGTIPLTGVTVALSLNGGTVFGTDDVDNGGQFTITGLSTLTGGSILTLYIDGSIPHDAVTVTTGSGGAMTGITLIRNTVIVRSGTGTHLSHGNPVTSTTLNVANNNADSDISALYTMSSLNTTIISGKRIYVWTGSTMFLEGTLTIGTAGSTSKMHIDGNFLQGNNAVSGPAHYTQSGGTFIGSPSGSVFNMDQSFTLDGGTFIATTGTTSIGAGMAVSSPGFFNANGGTVTFDGVETIDVGTTVFNNVTFAAGVSQDIAITGTLDVNGDLTVTMFDDMTSGTINVAGNVITTSTSPTFHSTVTLIIDGTGDQVIKANGGTGDIPNLQINKASGTLSFQDTIVFTSNAASTIFDYVSGTVNFGTGTLQFGASANATFTISPNGLTFKNVDFNGGTTADYTTIGTMDIDGILTLTSLDQLNGTIKASSGINLLDTAVTGTVTLILDGGNNQVIRSVTSADTPNGPIYIAKSAGIVTLSGALTANTSGQDLFLTGATLDLNGYNLTVNDRFDVGTGTTLRLNGDETISGGPDRVQRGATIWYDDAGGSTQLLNVPYYHLILGSTGSTTFRYGHARQMNLTGSLTISGGTLTVTNGQSLNVSGSLIQYKSGAFSAGTGTVNLRTVGPATLSGTSAFNNLSINSGLMTYLKLDEANVASGSYVKDSTGLGNSGRLLNMSQTGWLVSGAPTNFNNPHHLYFDGNDSIRVTDKDYYSPASNDISIAMWFKVPTTATAIGSSCTGGRNLVSKGFTNPHYEWTIANLNNTSICYAPGTTGGSSHGTALSYSMTVNDGAWHHVAISHDYLNSMKLFVDGVLRSTTTSFSNTMGNATQPVLIGRFGDPATPRYFIGSLDDIRFYDRALAASEVARLAAGYQDTGSGMYTLGTSLDVNGTLSMIAGGINAGSKSITLAGNLANYGTFTKGTSTVTLDGSGHQTVSGSTVFNALSATTSTARTIFFDYSGRQSASGSLTLRGVSGNKLSLRSTRSASGARVDLDVDASQISTDFTYADVKDINAGSGQTLTCYTNAEGCTNSGNNTNWTFTDPGHSITGTVYSNTGATTPLSGVTVALSLNGATSVYSDATDAGGQFSIQSIDLSALTGGTILTLYIDGSSSYKAVTVSTGSGDSMTGITLIRDNLIVRSGTGTHVSVGSPITSTTLNVANNNADADITAIYTMSSLNTTIVTGKTMYVWTGSTFNLGGTLTVGSSRTNARLHLDGNFVQNNNVLTLNAHYTQSGGTFTGSTGGSEIDLNGTLAIDGGTFIASTGTTSVGGFCTTTSTTIFAQTAGSFSHNAGTVTFDSDRNSCGTNGSTHFTIDVPSVITFNNVIINGPSTMSKLALINATPNDTINIAGNLTISDANLSGTGWMLQGNLSVGAADAGGTALGTVTLNGVADQTYAYTADGTAPTIIINKTSGVVNAAVGTTDFSITGFALPRGTFTAPSGTLTVGFDVCSLTDITIFSATGGTFQHNNGTISFIPAREVCGTNGTTNYTIDVASSLTLNNVIVNADASAGKPAFMLVASGDAIEVLGDFSLTEGNVKGLWRLKNDMLIGSSAGTANSATTVVFTGTGTQVLEQEGGTAPGGIWTIAKPSGTATLSGALTLNTSGQDLFLTGSTLDLNGFNLTVNDRFDVGTGTTLRLNGDETVSGGPDRVQRGATIWYDDAGGSTQLLNVPYYHLILGSTGSTTFRYGHAQQLNLTGSLTISGGTLTVTNGQRLNISGSLIQYKGGSFSAGTGTVNLRGLGANLTLSGSSSLNNLNINNGLVLYWKLDEGTGSTVAKDSSGNGNNGTLTNGPTWSNVVPTTMKFQNNRSLHFDGSNDYVYAQLTPPTANQTTAMWIKTSSVSKSISGFSGGIPTNAAHDRNIYIRNDGTVSYRVWDGAGPIVTSTATVNNGAWHHVAARYMGGQGITLFIDGVGTTPVSSGVPYNSYSTAYFTVGIDSNAGAYFPGNIDDVRLYNRALANSEVARLAAGYQDTGSGTYTLGSSLDVNGNLSVIAGGINAGSKSINLAGNLANYGTFTKGTSTVTLDGSGHQTVSGSTVFNTLSATTSAARTIFFDYSGRQSASGSLTLRGVSGNTLSLRSTRSASGARVDLDVDATQLAADFSYADVKDINAGSGQTLNCGTSNEGCTNNGNNLNWDFSGPVFTDIRPQDGAPFADVRLPLRITFNQNVVKGSGSISIYHYNGTLFQSIPVGNAAVSFMNSTTLLIDHNTLATGTGYYVNIDSGAFQSATTGIDFEGISNATTWNFITTMNVEGIVYNEEGTAPVGAGVHVVWRKNGGAVVDDTLTQPDGSYSLTGATMAAGDVIAIYLDNGNEAVTMVRSPGRDIEGVDLYVNNVIIRSDQSGQPITTANLNTGYVGSEPQITNVFQMSGNNTQVQSGKRLMTVSDFNAGGNVVTPNATIRRGFTLGQHIFASSGVVLRGSGASFNAGTGSLQIKGPFTLSGGTFVQNQAPMRVTGNFVLNPGTTFTKATNGAAVTLAGDLELNAPGVNLGNVIIGESPDVITLSGDLLVDSLTIRANDTLVTNGYDITVLGTLTNSGTLTASAGTSVAVGGDLINNGTYTAASSTLTLSGSFLNEGTFNAGTSTVVLDGANQTLSGSTLFYNVQKSVSVSDTLWFGTGSVTSITNALTLQGVSGNLLSLRSTKAGTQRTIQLDAGGTQTIEYLSVKDSNAAGGQTLKCFTAAEGCVDAGNTTNWQFLPIAGTGTVKGLVWEDEDGDGVRDSGETAVFSGLNAALTGATGTGMSVNRSTSTSAAGQFFFSGALISNSAGYTVTINSNVAPTGYISTRKNISSNNVLGTGAVIDVRFGYVLPSTISGSIFVDTDENGVRDGLENEVFSGSTLNLTGTTATGGTINVTTLSNASGSFALTGLPPSNGSYLLVITPPSGYTPTVTNSRSVTIGTGGQLKTEQFGYVLTPVSSSSSSASSDESSAATTGEAGGGTRTEGPIVVRPQPVEEGTSSSTPAQTPDEQDREDDIETVRDLIRQAEERRLARERETAAEREERVQHVKERATSWMIGGQETVLKQVSPIVNGLVAVPSIIRAGFETGIEQIARASDVLTTVSDAAARQIATAVDAAVNVVRQTETMIADVTDRMRESVENTAAAAQQLVATVVDRSLESMSSTVTATRQIAVATFNIVGDSAQQVASTVKNAGDAAIALATNTLGTLGQTGESVAETISAAWTRTTDSITLFAQNAQDLGTLSAIQTQRAAQSIADFGTLSALQTTQIAQNIRDGQEMLNESADIAADIALAFTNDRLEEVGEIALATATVAIETTTDMSESMQETVEQLAAAVTDTASDLADTTIAVTDVALTVADNALTVAFSVSESMNDGFNRASENMAIAFEQLRKNVTPNDIASLPPARQYETEIIRRDDQILIAELHLSVFDSLGIPVRNTPVVLFSIPKISTTNEEGVATFREVEAGKHRLEVHVQGESVASREIIIEAPADIALEDLERVDAVMPVIQVLVADQSMHAAAPYQLPWLWAFIGLLSLGNAAWFGAWVWRRMHRSTVVTD